MRTTYAEKTHKEDILVSRDKALIFFIKNKSLTADGVINYIQSITEDHSEVPCLQCVT